ncbi:RbsD/FucU family protein [Pseudoduganella chitinolytica]|uniref:RbsD/FucU domain-containing protein n=1 Tax=Pseudoduganella chitinolytica TaxID=34070 RepID=A0ABY8BFS4_9BURK|nr:RbsD/FucU domain-containing protein [Pseudoduganella chitinolytica]WEF33577.1 RbsD/FucU domain-containing protein [Pseudoduganella chitinolytica]
MLRGIDPVLSPELLKVLAEMGHGDAVAVVDANFTAATLGRGKPLVRLPGIGLQRACAAVLSVLPLDLPGRPVAFMAVSDRPAGYRSGLQRELLALCSSAGSAAAAQCEAVERFAFYEQVRQAHAIVQTGELQPYANFLFRKGVLAGGG